jgi:hypothetical protein
VQNLDQQGLDPLRLLPRLHGAAGGMLGSGVLVCLFGAAYFLNVHSLAFFVFVQIVGGEACPPAHLPACLPVSLISQTHSFYCICMCTPTNP